MLLAQLKPKLRDLPRNVETLRVVLDLDGSRTKNVARTARENDAAVIFGAP